MFVFGFLGLLALGVATILLFPFGIYAPDLERAFSAAVARPVSLQKIHVDLYPEPALVLGKVQIGRNDDAIRIGEIRLHPDFKSLFSERRELRKVVVSGTQLQLERITGMPSIFAALAKPDDSPGIGFILLKNTDISFSGIALRNADAEIQRDSAGNMQALTARSADGSVILEARPTATAIDLAVEAYAWSFDADSRFVSDSLSFKGHLEKDTLMISGLEIRALDGLIQGDAIVHAGGAKPNLSGSVVFERINASRLSEALGIGRKLDGVIMGSVRFSANSDTWPAIFSSIDGEGEFSIQRGSLNGIDLAEAARRRVSGVPVQGGTTNFEQMSGKVRLGREKNQFYDLDISSGLMRSTGQIDIGMDGRLTGQLELQMKGSVNQTRVPVLVSGTLFAPTLQAGR
ncbi:MAG: AsmA-like C-terminal region-containing protein [Candidatus Accumulibacter sp.]|nr:AsmA-like C-terminal region-containing protein [Accumulibacter sp.]